METRTHIAGCIARGLLCHNLPQADSFGPAIRIAYPARSSRIPADFRIAFERTANAPAALLTHQLRIDPLGNR
ncbi:hypothetical protein [Burkholderia sp. TSV86]|uniref:hypothetical protein n=1 Tax=Burkholderia sp. TSV86 TaxID=1385594 RepID=UPI00075EB2C3|nr:hypothetical protein [Burkholderia sp. TSV86]KVE38207.1 hypothetical protein WS68_23680 [Burkholderia sp. TSV86]